MESENRPSPTAAELQAVLARIETAVLAVDCSLRLRFANPGADMLLRRADGLRLDGGRVSTLRPADRRAIATAVSSPGNDGPTPRDSAHGRGLSNDIAVRSQTSTVVLVWRGDDLSPYRVVVSRLSPDRMTDGAADASRANAVLFVDDPEEADAITTTERTMLRDAFALTPAEARLTVHLASGATLTEAAEAFGVSHNTVRAQLRAVFEKTGARRQADLIRLMSGCRSLKLLLT